MPNYGFYGMPPPPLPMPFPHYQIRGGPNLTVDRNIKLVAYLSVVVLAILLLIIVIIVLSVFFQHYSDS